MNSSPKPRGAPPGRTPPDAREPTGDRADARHRGPAARRGAYPRGAAAGRDRPLLRARLRPDHHPGHRRAGRCGPRADRPLLRQQDPALPRRPGGGARRRGA
ncbi:hypothetical protein SGPA1_40727 [Streptomyces misionensis JCM 4497]